MNQKKVSWMCDIWGVAKAALLWGDQPAPASILGRIQDYGAGAPSSRQEMRRELESLMGEALDVNCAIYLALSPSLPRGERLTETQYAGLYVAHLPVEDEDGRLMTLTEKANRVGVGRTTLQRQAVLARGKIAPYIGGANRRRAVERIISGLCVRDAR